MTNTELYVGLVSVFMKSFQQRTYPTTSKTPEEVRNFRGDLIEEELSEFRLARGANNKLEILDGLCDITYVVAGTLLTCGISPVPFTAKEADNNVFDWTIEQYCNNVIDECYQPIPCHKRMYAACNSCLTQLDRAGKKWNLPEAFKVVHDNNMKKLWNIKPTDAGLIATLVGDKFLVRNKNGKVIKPPDHRKVDLSAFI